MQISLLHTIDSNPAVFEQAARDAGLTAGALRHDVRPALRIAVDQAQATASAIPDSLKDEIEAALQTLAAGADAVIVTCATLGPVVDGIKGIRVPVIRADEALAEIAARAGTRIVVLCAAESAVAANRVMFERHARPAGATVDVRLVPQTWDLFKRGETAACLAAVAQAARAAWEGGADVVAFAHPWMAGAASALPAEFRPLDGASASLAMAARVTPRVASRVASRVVSQRAAP
ncbi:aspartate/glutamate racemase family protein [Achromobacter spanius]|uniref:Arylsulfatase n=1 Tax=Achromobacter spanius TaxID=217203 RepID=A0A2S0I7A2_9BURK|nr:aspartate/glutamate racemase family protein [Achromobacter spanius]AVJ27888.1 arylsulfatase [Achromobacter spanius]